MIYVKPKGKDKFIPITELNPTFKKIYSGLGGYHGHTYGEPFKAQFLMDSNDIFTVPNDHYFAMGDNSLNSLDSRYWGTVPRKNMLGKGFFVFYPFSRRWGIVDTKPPVQEPTSQPTPFGDIKEMHLQ
jgi:signal peptidase I